MTEKTTVDISKTWDFKKFKTYTYDEARKAIDKGAIRPDHYIRTPLAPHGLRMREMGKKAHALNCAPEELVLEATWKSCFGGLCDIFKLEPSEELTQAHQQLRDELTRRGERFAQHLYLEALNQAMKVGPVDPDMKMKWLHSSGGTLLMS